MHSWQASTFFYVSMFPSSLFSVDIRAQSGNSVKDDLFF